MSLDLFYLIFDPFILCIVCLLIRLPHHWLCVSLRPLRLSWKVLMSSLFPICLQWCLLGLRRCCHLFSALLLALSTLSLSSMTTNTQLWPRRPPSSCCCLRHCLVAVGLREPRHSSRWLLLANKKVSYVGGLPSETKLQLFQKHLLMLVSYLNIVS